MKTLNARLERLEAGDKPDSKPLPLVVEDSTTDLELERLRRNRHCAHRWSDAVELFVLPNS